MLDPSTGEHPGIIRGSQGLSRDNPGIIPGIIGDYPGIILGSSRNHLGIIQGSSRDNPGIIPGIIGDYPGIILGSSRNHPGIIVGERGGPPVVGSSWRRVVASRSAGSGQGATRGITAALRAAFEWPCDGRWQHRGIRWGMRPARPWSDPATHPASSCHVVASPSAGSEHRGTSRDNPGITGIIPG